MVSHGFLFLEEKKDKRLLCLTMSILCLLISRLFFRIMWVQFSRDICWSTCWKWLRIKIILMRYKKKKSQEKIPLPLVINIYIIRVKEEKYIWFLARMIFSTEIHQACSFWWKRDLGIKLFNFVITDLS